MYANMVVLVEVFDNFSFCCYNFCTLFIEHVRAHLKMMEMNQQ